MAKVPFIVLSTPKMSDTIKELKSKGVKITQEPKHEDWGESAIFEDLYGNVVNIVEPPDSPKKAKEMKIDCFSLLVNDQDEAKEYFEKSLGFYVLCDMKFGKDNSQRWLFVSPQKSDSLGITVNLAKTEMEKARVGNSWIGVLNTDNIKGFHEYLKNKGNSVGDEIKEAPFGSDTSLKDKWGNEWNIHQEPSTPFKPEDL